MDARNPTTSEEVPGQQRNPMPKESAQSAPDKVTAHEPYNAFDSRRNPALATAPDGAPDLTETNTSREQIPFAALPANAVNWIAVWRRNYLVWKKLAIASLFGNLADPMIYLFGLGFGLGLMVGHVDGVSYIAFLAAGTVASSVMMSASFESMYSGFSRMHVQRTWEAIMHTPLTLGDIVLGEVVWAASKSVLSGAAIMLVAGALGYASFPSMLLALPVIVLTGLAFASLTMIVTALAPSYDFFMFYQTLVLTPMLLLSGVFFPVTQLPAAARAVTQLLPLAHAVDLIRPAMLARPMDHAVWHVAVLALYAVGAFLVSAVLFRRRMMK